MRHVVWRKIPLTLKMARHGCEGKRLLCDSHRYNACCGFRCRGIRTAGLSGGSSPIRTRACSWFRKFFRPFGIEVDDCCYLAVPPRKPSQSLTKSSTRDLPRAVICRIPVAKGLVFQLLESARLLHLCVHFVRNLYSHLVADCVLSPIFR